MSRAITVAGVCTLCVVVMLCGCHVGRPSASDIEAAVLRDVATYYPYEWVREVEVIKYGDPYRTYFLVKEYEFWPVRVYFVGDQRKEMKEIHVFKDVFGEWRALP